MLNLRAYKHFIVGVSLCTTYHSLCFLWFERKLSQFFETIIAIDSCSMTWKLNRNEMEVSNTVSVVLSFLSIPLHATQT